eukprot:CAMPEP_0205941742 /NCGR_PEP_ID=MMETSP1325-20131115/55680_1 /ASSEMBLY_ACC=CAM_ASM_000708 /TAXON_ID=236786 /ORGANISM="Florenciella sp., Strain RCC1007" /LENGTH=34 /DNA_ID= /DNA_START= /DNA_END= /DNA_ORIENTATION=
MAPMSTNITSASRTSDETNCVSSSSLASLSVIMA